MYCRNDAWPELMDLIGTSSELPVTFGMERILEGGEPMKDLELEVHEQLRQ